MVCGQRLLALGSVPWKLKILLQLHVWSFSIKSVRTPRELLLHLTYRTAAQSKSQLAEKSSNPASGQVLSGERQNSTANLRICSLLPRRPKVVPFWGYLLAFYI